MLSLLILVGVLYRRRLRSQPATRVMRLTLDHLVPDPHPVQRELETTKVSVRYTVEEYPWEWTAGISDTAVVMGAET